MPSQPALPTAQPPGLDRLFAEGRQAVRAGTHQTESPPTDDGPALGHRRDAAPRPQAARSIELVAIAAASGVGANHWLAGAARSSPPSLRRHLESRRRHVSPADPLRVRYAAALRSAAKATGPVRFTLTGLTLTPISVMAAAVPTDTAADDLAAAFDRARHAQGCHDAGTTPALWHVNLAYFTGPVRDAEELISWVRARQQMHIADVRGTSLRIVRRQHTATGTMPVVLASAPQRCDVAAHVDPSTDTRR